ncbi:hypothetical protein [Streptomyces sp. NPDC005244]|uniref:hypothetical protein n=1 Tax=Streptomyces sp. NPDC005244 TaxID=3364708 RepID=UPI0036AE056E
MKLLLPASAPREGYRPTYVVLARDGDTLTLRKLGFPDSATFECSVNNLDPSYGGTR